ncbi:MAG: Na+/H+ antiporter subunit E [Pseudohongiella sp.]|nr:Na+/H+ antiporter subunit E [Pseudohongiella sp.]MDO9519792.1 Na+/H+ antiporter subunit E [Pseudohongiella sp.]MDP2126242.1 Na+/H+ antiporter subunit E [Pseudohongiella sp.]
MKHITGLMFFAAILWWILSGYTKPLLISLGIVSVLFTAFLAHRMKVLDDESQPLHLSLALPRFWGYLLWQIVVANIKMVIIIMSPKMNIDPHVLRARVSQQGVLGNAILGNSITLTPGTVTLDIGNGEVEVHAINRESAEDVENGVFDQRIPGRKGVRS